MSKTISLHHIVFATKYRKMTIPDEVKKSLYAYILGITRNKNCHLIRINGIPNHVHILVDLHPSVSIAELVKEIKQSSSKWLRTQKDFPMFEGWGDGYYACSLSANDIESCKSYIINQETHHHTNGFLVEMEEMANRNRLRWYNGDWE